MLDCLLPVYRSEPPTLPISHCHRDALNQQWKRYVWKCCKRKKPRDRIAFVGVGDVGLFTSGLSERPPTLPISHCHRDALNQQWKKMWEMQ